MIGLVVGKVKSFVMGVLALLSTFFGFLFLVQTLRYKNLEEEKEDLEKEVREREAVIREREKDIQLAEKVDLAERAIDEEVRERLKEIDEEAKDEGSGGDSLLDRLNSMWDKDGD